MPDWEELPEAVRTAVTRYLDHLTVERGAARSTLEAYRRDLRRYAAFLVERGITDLASVTAQHLADFQADLSQPAGDRRPLARSSAARTLVAARGLHRFAQAEGMRGQAERLAGLGAKQVLLKGGHLEEESSVDVFFDGGAHEFLHGERVATTNDHGTGCTLAASVAALRPQRSDWLEAVTGAKQYLTGALRAADRLDVGQGRGPVHHFHRWW